MNSFSNYSKNRKNLNISFNGDDLIKDKTRMHSSRMRTARSLTISHSIRRGSAQPPNPRMQVPFPTPEQNDTQV